MEGGKGVEYEIFLFISKLLIFTKGQLPQLVIIVSLAS